MEEIELSYQQRIKMHKKKTENIKRELHHET